MDQRPLRAAVIGVGAMGRNHARVYNEIPDVDLVAAADLDSARVQETARLYGARPYTDYRRMLEEVRPEIVSVAVPTQHHFSVAVEVMEAGCHVLVEKPITATLEEGQRLIERAAELGRVLAIGHIERYNPAVIELKRRLDAGELGQIFQIHARRLGPFPARVRDVGVVVDLAPHDLDIMRYLTGSRVRRLYAETEQEIHTDHEDLFAGLLRFENGVVGVLTINWLTPTKVREITVTGQRGMFLANLLTQDLYFYENEEAGGLDWNHLRLLRGVSEGRMVRLRLHRREPLRVELETFVKAVRQEPAGIVTGEDGLSALRLAHALVRSGREGRVIELDGEG
ncbi:MAG TPA: Gfo/Idh/MocA family oxidoreductase [Chloroflexi bacterium]|nr:Gfo/Idh/MocA family oxidoreductase [Chloroflexota bacterium]